MKRQLLCFLICACFCVNGFSQNNAQTSNDTSEEIYFMKGADGLHYINNDIHYTMKFLGTDIEYMDNGAFKIQDHIITLIETPYETSHYNNGKSVEDEKKLLATFKEKEVAYFQDFSEEKIDVKEQYFFNKEGKLFYMYSFDIPIEKVNTEEDYLMKMYFLCFVVNNKLSTMSFPLFKSEDENEKNTYIKALTESVDIFPSKISVDFLRQRVLNTENEDLVVDYGKANFSFTVPDYLNVLQSNDQNMWAASFPDVNNIKNVAVVRMIKKEEYESLEAFNKEVLPQGKIGDKDDRMTILLKEELENVGQINGKSIRFQYMPNGTMRMYHAKKVTFETKTHYGLVMFNATTETYIANIDRFDAFLETFKIVEK